MPEAEGAVTGSTYEVRPWKDPDNPEFRELNPEYARTLREDRDRRAEELRRGGGQTTWSTASTPRCAPLSPAARQAIAYGTFRNSASQGSRSGLSSMSEAEQRRLYAQWKQRPWGSVSQMHVYAELKRKFEGTPG